MSNTRNIFVLILLLIVSTLLLASIETDNNSDKIKIVIIGDGVPPLDDSANRPFPLNNEQGSAMYNGATAALNYSPEFSALRDYVELIGFDDAGDPTLAKEKAISISRNPRVLAVIGHATSETTINSAPYYDNVGLPFLMPIATSPDAMYPPNAPHNSDNRYQRSFRLVPSDTEGQAPAISYFVNNNQFSNIYLLHDNSPGAVKYSIPLKTSVEHLLNKNIINRSTGISRENFDFTSLASNIRAQGSDIVIFCGYGSTARVLLSQLDIAFFNIDSNKRPKILLTDGCYVPDLDPCGFKVYMTFPHISKPPNVNDIDYNNLSKISSHTQGINYEGFGYDSMLIIGKAINKCISSNIPINRANICYYLDGRMTFIGTCGIYEFYDGENLLSKYDILELVKKSHYDRPTWHLINVITSEELQSERTKVR